MNKRTFRLSPSNPKWRSVLELAQSEAERRVKAGEDCEIEVREPKRSLDANAAMWATLADISKQVDWPHTVRGEWVIAKMDNASWKSVLTAGFEQETQMAQGVSGGMVMVGASTSKFTKRKMGEFLEFAHAFGTDRSVKWSDRSLEDLAQWAPKGRG